MERDCFETRNLNGILLLTYWCITVSYHVFVSIGLSLSLNKREGIFPLGLPFFLSRPVRGRSSLQREDGHVFVAFHLHQLHRPEPHRATRWEALSEALRGRCCFLRAECSLSVCCSQTVPPPRPQVHSRGPIRRTVYMDGRPLSNECRGTLKRWKTAATAGMAVQVGVSVDYFCFGLSPIKTRCPF